MPSPLIGRRILSVIADRMSDTPVVVLQGARSVGKSTVLAELARQHDVTIGDARSGPVQRIRRNCMSSTPGSLPTCSASHQRSSRDAIRLP